LYFPFLPRNAALSGPADERGASKLSFDAPPLWQDLPILVGFENQSRRRRQSKFK
jgi:hypothetical protein